MNDFNLPKVGDRVTGEVIKVEKDCIYLDLQSMTEGLIYLNEYDYPAPKSFTNLVKAGDLVTAEIKKVSEKDESILILLSRMPIVREEGINELKKLDETKEPFVAKVVKSLDRGLILKYNLFELFLPLSLLDREYLDDKDGLINKDLEVVMEQFQPGHGRRMRIIVSRRPIIEKDRQAKYRMQQELREAELETLNTGDIVEGVVERIEKHAAHIKFEHVTGLLRISQVAHYRIDKLEDELQVGETVRVKIIKREGNRIDLSRKALLPTPFEKFAKDFKKGDKVIGKVVQKLAFGVIIEVAPHVTGLLHNQEYTWNPRDNFRDYFNIGDEVEVVIIHIDKGRERIALSRKLLEDNPWESINLKYGDIIEVYIDDIADDSLSVAYQSVDGIIRAKEATEDRVNLENAFTKGETVRAMVIKFSKKDWVLELSVRRLQEQEERKEFEKFLVEDDTETTATIGDLLNLSDEDKK